MSRRSARRLPLGSREDIERVLDAIRLAGREAVERHRLAGNPIATCKNGRVVWIQAKDITPLAEIEARERNGGPAPTAKKKKRATTRRR